jgi:hypothetical protein
MSTIVGTNIEVTNLKYDSDTTSMIISNTGQVTVQGEGSATTSLQQGLAKSWVRFNGQGTVAIRDSYSVSSLTDSGTGQYYVNIATAMTDGNYSFSSLAGGNSDSNNTFTAQYYFNGANLASATAFPVCSKFNGSVYDNSNISVLIHGDLA